MKVAWKVFKKKQVLALVQMINKMSNPFLDDIFQLLILDAVCTHRRSGQDLWH